MLLKWQILQRIPTVCFKRNILAALRLGPDQSHGLTCFSDTLFVDSTAHEELEYLSPNQKGGLEWPDMTRRPFLTHTSALGLWVLSQRQRASEQLQESPSEGTWPQAWRDRPREGRCHAFPIGTQFKVLTTGRRGRVPPELTPSLQEVSGGVY